MHSIGAAKANVSYELCTYTEKRGIWHFHSVTTTILSTLNMDLKLQPSLLRNIGTFKLTANFKDPFVPHYNVYQFSHYSNSFCVVFLKEYRTGLTLIAIGTS